MIFKDELTFYDGGSIDNVVDPETLESAVERRNTMIHANPAQHERVELLKYVAWDNFKQFIGRKMIM